MFFRVLAAAVAVAFMTGCSGSDTSADPQARVEAAIAKLAAAENLHIDVSTDRLPDGVTGLLKATGDGNRQPAFSGEVTVVAGGASIKAAVVAVGDDVWAKTSFAPDFLAMDPAKLGGPNPAHLIGTGDDGVVGLLDSITELTDAGSTRDGKAVVTRISGVADAEDVAALLPTADPQGNYSVELRLDDDDVLYDASITGPIVSADDVTYRVIVRELDEPVTIEAP